MTPETSEISFQRAQADDDAIRALLEESKLPTESVGRTTTEFFVAERFGVVVGVAGFEFYGEDALLRSVAVQPELRNSGVGSRLVDWMIAFASQKGLKNIFLLTNTAQRFFERKGFTVTDRSTVTNKDLSSSSEFAHICPVSSICMKLDLR